MLLAAMLAMVLAAAAPAFAQATIGDETQYVDCSQVQAAVAGQYGDANAAADDESIAGAANELGISQTQVNACLGDINVGGGDDDGTVVADDDGTVVADDDGGTVAAGDDGSASAAAATAAAAGELPETGGASLLALGAGALLVAGGLVARRIVR